VAPEPPEPLRTALIALLPEIVERELTEILLTGARVLCISKSFVAGAYRQGVRIEAGLERLRRLSDSFSI
jgi:hypothetical protein